MGSRYEDKREPVRQQNMQKRQTGDSSIYRKGAQAPRMNTVRRQRYQQEELAGDWQQDWDRTPYDNRNDKRFTVGQFVLISMILMLVLAMAAMGAFWFAGRSGLRHTPGNETVIQQSYPDRSADLMEDGMPEDNIVILDTAE